jgi:hypothetical protein
LLAIDGDGELRGDGGIGIVDHADRYFEREISDGSAH